MIQKDLEKREVLEMEQIGFTKDSRCIDQVFILSSLMRVYLARKKKLVVTFIDWEESFDKVDHALLWQKLWRTKKGE